jgi:hypothetical protein
MSSSSKYRLWIPLVIGILAIALMGFGAFSVQYKVLEEPTDDEEEGLFLFFEKISEPEMIYNSTFAGIQIDSNGNFYFAYDRNAGGGAKPCPT